MNKTFSKTWQHSDIESELYEKWENKGYFKPEINKGGKPFTIAIPPPNVTGKLHIGHALTSTIEDIMIRYHRLLGDQALWIPGMDHAGIATQSVVMKKLSKQGVNGRELGREKFVKEVWNWKKESGGKIIQQLKAVGSSCDWSRERFTLDDGLSDAVREAFVHLYKKDLVYRGEYIVNWCPKCGTAIADDEVEHETQKAKLYYFKYDKNFPITIATTRPETKLGDTAVAVNLSDDRYSEYVNKKFEVDIDGVKRKIKVIADRSIDREFGTGAVGLTPAHSIVDWKMADDHDLPKIKVIDEHGRMTSEAGKYEGLKVLEAREKIVEYLKSADLLEKEEEIENNLSICYRCNRAIEPLPSLQWFVKMKPLSEKAKEAVKSGEIKIIPKRFEKVYFHWLDNIRDWCISRQLWWGHQIPVWYKGDEVYVGKDSPEGEGWKQEEDVLDTWFSSALWPFSTLGWPDESAPDYLKFYPTTVMETGYDILFFWVARMIMMGVELTGKIPFETVYLHGLIRNEDNSKMSKSSGKSIDPLDVIAKYGADALRMALVVGSTPGQDMALSEGKIKGYRNFTNKIWNASRFVSLRVTDGDLQSGELGSKKIKNLEIDESLLTSADKNILKEHKEIIKSMTDNINSFKFSLAGETLYEYFWHSFCDRYIEESKKQLQEGIMNHESRIMGKTHNSQFTIHNSKLSENTKKVLIKVLSETLVMLHPYVPFVTDAVWQELREFVPNLSESIIISNWPACKS